MHNTIDRGYFVLNPPITMIDSDPMHLAKTVSRILQQLKCTTILVKDRYCTGHILERSTKPHTFWNTWIVPQPLAGTCRAPPPKPDQSNLPPHHAPRLLVPSGGGPGHCHPMMAPLHSKADRIPSRGHGLRESYPAD
jgi:hypothetical protein